MTSEPVAPTPLARIEILGPFRLWDATGREVQVPKGKNMALLAYLAAESTGADRATLEHLFWPDSSARAQRQSLRQALSTLRKLLGTDPFVMGDRIRLDGSLCTNDYEEFREALWHDDAERCLRLFRGAPLSDIASGVSLDLDHWVERRREAALQRLGAVVQSMGRDALDDANEKEAQRVIRLGVRGGLMRDSLHAAIYGTPSDRSSWAAATIGSPGLETLVFRARPGLESLMALVVEDEDGWAPKVVTELLALLPEEGRPALVHLPDQTGAPEDEIAALMRLLASLPGGAAVRQSTLELIENLASNPGSFEDHRTRSAAESALADALDAALDEQALVLTLRAAGTRLQPASILARALALQGGEGATLVVYGATERELSALPVQTLLNACRELRHVRQGRTVPLGPPLVAATPQPVSPPEALEAGVEVVAPPRGPTPGPLPASPAPGEIRARYRSEIHQRVKHLGYLAAAAFAVGAAGLAFATGGPSVSPPRPVTDYDILFCSNRTGVFQYFRWSAATRIVERVTADTALANLSAGEPTCIPTGFGARDGDSLYLAVAVGGGPSEGGTVELRKYPNVPTRADLSGRVVISDSARFASIGDSMVATFDTEGLVGMLHHLGTGERTPWPAGWNLIHAAHGPVLAGGLSGGSLVRLDIRTGAVEMHPELEEWGAWRGSSGDSVITSRGRRGEEEDGSLEVVLHHLGTGQEERLTDNDWNDYDVQWSPDGRHICWQSEELGHYRSEIMVMDLRTRRSWNLSSSEGRDWGCHFTPDGRAVVYLSLRTGNVEVWLQPVEGGEAVDVTLHPSVDAFAGFVKAVGGGG